MVDTQTDKPLRGWRVLIPRGGTWGDDVAAQLRARGATPVVAPLINFAPTDDPDALTDALALLEKGAFDWLTVTSATTVDVLKSQRVSIPSTTQVAAVGESTAAALLAVGYKVDLVPANDNSARGMVQELTALEPNPRNILTLRSEIAKPVLTQGLIEAGHNVRQVVAYRTIGEPVSDRVIAEVRSGRINALLVTSGSVAEQVALQFGALPASTIIAAIGPRTAQEAAEYGLTMDVVSRHQTVSALLDTVVAAVEAGHIDAPQVGDPETAPVALTPASTDAAGTADTSGSAADPSSAR